jgi:hypothetical protein
MRIELISFAWKANNLPLIYTQLVLLFPKLQMQRRKAKAMLIPPTTMNEKARK